MLSALKDFEPRLNRPTPTFQHSDDLNVRLRKIHPETYKTLLHVPLSFSSRAIILPWGCSCQGGWGGAIVRGSGLVPSKGCIVGYINIIYVRMFTIYIYAYPELYKPKTLNRECIYIYVCRYINDDSPAGSRTCWAYDNDLGATKGYR